MRNEEGKLQDKIISMLNTLDNAFFYKASDSYQRGIPDIVGVYKGLSIWIEVKTESGKLSRMQIMNLVKIIKSGGVGFVAKSVEDVVDRFVAIQQQIHPQSDHHLLDSFDDLLQSVAL